MECHTNDRVQEPLAGRKFPSAEKRFVVLAAFPPASRLPKLFLLSIFVAHTCNPVRILLYALL